MSAAKQQLVLVRHGETQWSKDGRHTGTSDIPLTEHGRDQARQLNAVLRTWHFELVLTSPLQRALDTCRLSGFGDVAKVRPDLVEWDYGRYDGKTSDEIRQTRPDWSLWGDGGPAGENATDVGIRVDRVISEIRSSAGNVLVFAHGHVLRVLAARWLDEPPEDGRHYALGTAALGVLSYEHDDAVIQRWNQPPPD